MHKLVAQHRRPVRARSNFLFMWPTPRAGLFTVPWLCAGLLLLRSQPEVVAMWSDLVVRHRRALAATEGSGEGSAEPRTEQEILNALLVRPSSGGDKQPFAYVPLPVDLFPNGASYPWAKAAGGGRPGVSQDASSFVGRDALPSRKPLVVHNNYLRSHDEKVLRFQRSGFWLIDSKSERMQCNSF